MNRAKSPSPFPTSLKAGQSPRWPWAGILILLIPAALKLLVQLLAVRGYGLSGDELYYLACSDHLGWGYVDQPPLSLLLLHIQRLFFGNSMLSIRLLPALAGFFTVLLTGLLARRMGAGLFGQLLAEICVLVAPVYLALNHIFSMNAFDVLFWLAAIYILVCIIDGGKPTLWLGFGLVMGLGFQNKTSVLFLGFGLAVGLVLTQQRRLLFTRWVWVGALVAGVLTLPYLVWQIIHGWPTIEWMNNALTRKMVALSPPAFLGEQIGFMHPLTFLIWGTGLVALLARPAFARYRALGWSYLAILTVLVIQGGKPYYLAPFYPALLASGAAVIERWLAKRWMKTVIVLVLLAGGALTAPFGMPLLPVDTFIRYQNSLGIRPASGERYAEGQLPFFFTNMFGWKKLAATVDAVYRSLPLEDRVNCGIWGRNYMLAGAIDFYGGSFGLPRAISGHNSYWIWGMRGYTGEVMIVLGMDAATLKKYFGEVTERARFRDEYIQPIYSDLPILVVRKPKQPLASIWPKIKSFI